MANRNGFRLTILLIAHLLAFVLVIVVDFQKLEIIQFCSEWFIPDADTTTFTTFAYDLSCSILCVQLAIVTSQIALLALCLVLAARWRTWFAALAATIVSFGSVLRMEADLLAEQMYFFAFVIPFAGILRIWFRIERAEEEVVSKKRSFTSCDLFLLTTFVGVIIFLARIVASSKLLFQIAFFFGFTLLPVTAVWVALRPNRIFFRSIYFWVFVLAIAWLLGYGKINFDESQRLNILFSACYLMFATIVFGTLLIFRVSSVHLVRRTSKSSVESEDPTAKDVSQSDQN